MSSTAEQRLDQFLNNYRIITTATETEDLQTANTLKKIFITVEQKEITPEIMFSRSVVPYFAPTEDRNQFIAGLTGLGEGLSHEFASFFAGITYLKNLGHEMIYDGDQLRQGEYATIAYQRNGINMYGAFKALYDNSNILLEYPQFYSITGAATPYGVTAFGGVTSIGASAGTYTLVNFGGTITPFQIMYHPSTIGITHSNGLPTGTAGNPLYFGLSGNMGITESVKSIYFTPDVHVSTRRNLSILLDRGITFSAIISSFEPHYQFIKRADNDFVDLQNNIISQYAGNTANPGWSVELARSSGKTGNYINIDGFVLYNDFIQRFFSEIKTYPKRYRTTANTLNIGQYGYPYTTSVFGWSSSIPTPGTATDATGPYASVGSSFYLNRIAGLTLYPPPSSYNYAGTTGFGGSGGSTGWNSYHKSLTGQSSFYPEYFMLGGATNAASNTYAASRLIPANILKLFSDNRGPRGPLGTTMNFLDSYYYDIYQEQLQYGGYKDMNLFPMEFSVRFNPYIPMQIQGSFAGTTSRNFTSRRDCTIHQDMGGNTAERLFNLKNSMRDSIHSALKMWKLLCDERGKFSYRIMPVVSGWSEDHDLTRGGSVPYTPADFVEYIVSPMFDGIVSANGLILKNDVGQLLLNGFYYGNIARGSDEYTRVVTNRGVSGSDPTTSFIRGLETYFFDLQQLQAQLTFSTFLTDDLGLTAAASDYSAYYDNLRSGRFSDYRVFETNSGLTGGNTKIPYGFAGTFKWNVIPLNTKSILYTNVSLRDRWISTQNNSTKSAYVILRDAYFELAKEQLNAASNYFKNYNITTLVEYRATDQFVGR